MKKSNEVVIVGVKNLGGIQTVFVEMEDGSRHYWNLPQPKDLTNDQERHYLRDEKKIKNREEKPDEGK
jgi:hypothetical protein